MVAFDALAICVAAALNVYGVRRVALVGRISELPSSATEYLIARIQGAALWSRFDAIRVTLGQRHPVRGLVRAGIHRFVMQADWSRKRHRRTKGDRSREGSRIRTG